MPYDVDEPDLWTAEEQKVVASLPCQLAKVTHVPPAHPPQCQTDIPLTWYMSQGQVVHWREFQSSGGYNVVEGKEVCESHGHIVAA